MKSLEFRKVNFLSFTGYIFPSITMMLVLAFYTIVDGAFIAAFVGSDALAGANIVYPLNNLVLGVGIMFATGSSAAAAVLFGQGKKREAQEKFSFSTVASLSTGLALMGIMLALFRPILRLLGATDQIYSYCYQYGLVLVMAAPLTVLKEVLISYLRVDGRPGLSLAATLSGGVLNIGLDWLFVKQWGWGVTGAAVATVIGITVSLLMALVYFLSGKSGLRFCRFKMDLRFLTKMMGNGSSEMVNQVSAGITTLAFNWMALRFFGADGVAAVTIMMYAQFIFVSLFLGLSMGSAPLFSFHYGAGRYRANRKLMGYSFGWIGCASILLLGIAFFFSGWIAGCFSKPGTQVYFLAARGIHLFSLSLIFSGLNLFVSGLFTALNNGLLSSLVAFCRSLVFLLGTVLLLPIWLGFDGLWLAAPVSEALTFVVSILAVFFTRKTYHFLPETHGIRQERLD